MVKDGKEAKAGQSSCFEQTSAGIHEISSLLIEHADLGRCLLESGDDFEFGPGQSHKFGKM